MNRDNIVTRWECYAQSKNGYSTIVHKPSTKDTKEIYRTVLVIAQIVTAKIISHFLDYSIDIKIMCQSGGYWRDEVQNSGNCE
jgi:hypothetical protein